MENKRTARQIFTLALLRGWNSVEMFCRVLGVLFLVIGGINILFGNGILGILFGLIILVVTAGAGLPTAILVGFASGILYAVSETFWERVSVCARISAWLIFGLSIGIVAYFLGIAVFQPFKFIIAVLPAVIRV